MAEESHVGHNHGPEGHQLGGMGFQPQPKLKGNVEDPLERQARAWKQTLDIWIKRFKEAQGVIRQQDSEIERLEALVEQLAVHVPDEVIQSLTIKRKDTV